MIPVQARGRKLQILLSLSDKEHTRHPKSPIKSQYLETVYRGIICREIISYAYETKPMM